MMQWFLPQSHAPHHPFVFQEMRLRWSIFKSRGCTLAVKEPVMQAELCLQQLMAKNVLQWPWHLFKLTLKNLSPASVNQPTTNHKNHRCNNSFFQGAINPKTGTE